MTACSALNGSTDCAEPAGKLGLLVVDTGSSKDQQQQPLQSVALAAPAALAGREGKAAPCGKPKDTRSVS